MLVPFALAKYHETITRQKEFLRLTAMKDTTFCSLSQRDYRKCHLTDTAQDCRVSSVPSTLVLRPIEADIAKIPVNVSQFLTALVTTPLYS